MRRPRAHAVTPRRTVGVAAIALIATSCSPSPAAELADAIAAAPELDRYQLAVTIGDPGLFDCFPTGGTAILSFDVGKRRLSVSESGDDDHPALVAVDGVVTMRPAAFSSGPDEWWQIAESTPRSSVDRVVGPIVAELGLSSLGEQPAQLVERLVADADEVTRLGTDRYRVIDRSGDPTIADLTLDDHGHVAQVAVSAEDPRRSGTIDATQAGYVARYQDETTEPETLDAQIERNVDEAVLDQLDNRPGACGATVSP